MHRISLWSSLLVLGAFLLGCQGDGTEAIEASGTIEGTDIDLAAEVTGRVLAVRCDEGSRVQIGDTLVILDDEDYQIQLRQQLANLAAAEAQYTLAREGSRREDIALAEATLKNAQTDFRRMQELLENHTITQKQYDDAQTRYVTAQQTYEKVMRGLRPAEIQAARAKRDQAAAQVEQSRKRVKDCRIVAPAQGTVTLRGVEPGEFVVAGSNVLRITNLDRVKLTIYITEEQLGMVRVGDVARISVDAYPGRTYEGKVVYISPVAEFTPKNVQTKEERTKLVFGVKIEAANSEGVLKPGMPADAKILLDNGQ
jgi:HlyD family secretion protein